LTCPACEADNRTGARFCRECGRPLALACPACGVAVGADQRFCDACGHNLADPAQAPADDRGAVAERVSERRLVSVVFADLVGFTALSESRDAEEVRELLSRYFDTCRRLVERYGGTVEKFIGDAVMAVWGTPTANEDDAERAVRTGLDLVAAVQGLTDELGADVKLRVGVLTGEAAVTVGARGEGMVAGDLVNTASRIQSIAEPSTVVVGDVTRRATEAAIAYEDIGFHQLKGKAEPVRLHRARRVIAARRGEGRSDGLEPPFVGREREFRLVKELFHASAEERRARLVSIVGVAGIGKSRLSWEFEKYTDGLIDEVLWHRGRCLAYGEGVAYWALAEMVRMRARVSEEESGDTALPKLRETLAAFVPDADERAFLEPRLAHLLGLADRSAPDKEDLFSAWRLFFERMAAVDPVVLVFEDLQWADAGLLDFVEYLLDWARDHPIYVVTLARPELAERRSAWGVGRRDFTSLFLEPLSPEEIGTLLAGTVPGLPDEIRRRVVEQADGVPLYAVETVRMLLDRGLLKRDGEEYRPAGPIETLAVPETLQSLAAARLDALAPVERRLLEDASVLGRAFTRTSLAAISGCVEEELEPHLQSLLRKEILTRQLDPMSPERDQLAFLQDILRRVAYETLSVHDRKRRHLAAAAHLTRDGDDDVAAVLAAHYLEAYRLGPSDPDGTELRNLARLALVRAGERASSLASAGEAARYFERAAELTEAHLERAALLERAGREWGKDLEIEAAERALQEAGRILREQGERHGAARVAARLAEVLRTVDRVREALELMRPAYDELVGGERSPEVALVAAQLSRIAYFAGERDLALATTEVALDMGEVMRLPEVLAEGLTTKATLLYHRPHEAGALLQEAIRIAKANDLTTALLRAQFNFSGLAIEHDRLADGRATLEDALAQARLRGDRTWEALVLGQLAEVLVLAGDWDEAWALLDPLGTRVEHEFGTAIRLSPLISLLLGRGLVAEARAFLEREAALRDSSDLQTKAIYLVADAEVCFEEGRYADSQALARQATELWRALNQPHYEVFGYVTAVEASLALGEVERATVLLQQLESMPLVERRALVEAQASRLRAKIAVQSGDDGSAGFAEARRIFAQIGMPYWEAVSLVESGNDLDEARAIFDRLGARLWLDRLQVAAAGDGLVSAHVDDGDRGFA
jgi:class 3 adenylate cyclase/tetratricopeptide (TPR) repeat protein